MGWNLSLFVCLELLIEIFQRRSERLEDVFGTTLGGGSSIKRAVWTC